MPISTPQPPPSVYNPQANTPIKVPDQEFCITCGHPLSPKVKPLTNDMSQYLNGDDKKSIVVVHGLDNIINLKGVNFYRIKGIDPITGKVTTFEKVPDKVAPPTPPTNPKEQDSK